MRASEKIQSRDEWRCIHCNKPLEVAKIRSRYLGNVFSVDLLKCPECGIVMVTEEIALGKMAEAEAVLEDK